MAMRLLLANVSQTELTLLDQPIRPPREGGFRVLQTLEALAEDLRMPYLYPALRRLRQADQFPHRILLFATDQGERGPSETDTIYFARAIRRLVAYHFGMSDEQILLHTYHGNPNEYDTAFRYYGDLLQGLDEASAVFVALTPASAAMVSALLIRSLLRFGSKLKVIYVGKPGPDEGYGRAHLLDLGQELSRLMG